MICPIFLGNMKDVVLQENVINDILAKIVQCCSMARGAAAPRRQARFIDPKGAGRNDAPRRPGGDLIGDKPEARYEPVSCSKMD
uniref:Uncharacterized protein n=1 Tax=Steinernema glaseri TaxID=37863 RepID=A0A1I7YZ82_9BILA